MPVVKVSGEGIAALNVSGLPIRVQPGDRVAITAYEFDYKGPAKTLYVCWGLKLGADFNNGAGLLGGASNFGRVPVSVQASVDWVKYSLSGFRAELTIPSNAPARVYDTWDWVAHLPSSSQADIVGGYIDLDDRIFEVQTLPAIPQVSNLQVMYVKVS